MEKNGGVVASSVCCSHDEEIDAAKSGRKVKLSYRLFVFIASVISLSWFFEGTRQVNESLTVPHVGLLILGAALTSLFIGIYTYWIYIEEKEKGTLKKRVNLFEKIYSNLHQKEEIAQGKGED
ncbi:MAG: hypothetical protein K2Z81_16695 [Cyanobacteria bacterium]|nr:hypothetical protein [Cyanobacteriota bacterium]